MQSIDNITNTVRDDLAATIVKGDRLSIAAACFSMYAFQELEKNLKGLDELLFIFTSSTFLTEKEPKAKREFCIPQLSRESSIYGTEFESRMRASILAATGDENPIDPSEKVIWSTGESNWSGVHPA